MFEDLVPQQGGAFDDLIPQKPLTWGDVPQKALQNAPGSAGQLLLDTAQPFLHPLETAGNMHKLFSGLGAKFGYGDPANEPYADAVGQFFKQRYGGMENIKNTLATDPVGAAADVGAVLTGGAALPERIPGLAGKVAGVVGQTGRAIDPLTQALRGAGRVGSEVLGIGAGTGGQAVRTAFKAGYTGGDAADTFQSHMRMPGAMADELIDQARTATGNMRAERSAQYEKGMAGINVDNSQLSFQPIADAIVDSNKVKTFHGLHDSTDLSPKTADVRSEILGKFDEWRQKAAYDARYQTPVGFDALKQVIGDIKDGQQIGTPQRKVASDIYSAIRQTIVKQAPEYANVMKGYERASKLLEDTEKSLSVGAKASTDTSLRKLTSVMRNNVNTNYGKRTALAEGLTKYGAPNLMEGIAGQTMSSYVPRGLGAASLGTNALLAYMTNPYLLAAAPFTSPRILGETAYYAGRGARHVPHFKAEAPNRAALLAALNEGRLPKE